MQNKALTYIICFLIFGWLIFQITILFKRTQTDFDHYYHASEKLVKHMPLYLDEMAVWARPQVPSWYIYPPYFAAAISPLLLLGESAARILFLLMIIAAFFAIDYYLILIKRIILPEDKSLDPLIHLSVFFSYSWTALLRSLQMETLMVLLVFYLTICLLEHRSTTKIGILYSLSVLTKLWPAPFILPFWINRGRVILFPILVTFFLVILLFTLTFGIEPQLYFFRYILPPLSHYSDWYIDNQSLLSFLERYVSQPLDIYFYLRIALLITYLGYTWRQRTALLNGDKTAILCNASLFCIISTLLTPTAWSSTYAKILLPLWVSSLVSMKSWNIQRMVIVITSWCLFLTPPETVPKVGILSELYYHPILLATIMQLGWFLVYTENTREMVN